MTTNAWTFADTAKALELAFPWLAVEPDSDEWEEPSGADVIAQLQEFYENLREADREESERGAVSIPLLAFQAGCAIGLASGVAAVVSWAQSVLGGLL